MCLVILLLDEESSKYESHRKENVGQPLFLVVHRVLVIVVSLSVIGQNLLSYSHSQNNSETVCVDGSKGDSFILMS